MAVRKITRDSLKRAPLHELLPQERDHAYLLIELAGKREWTEAERRKAADHEVKAWAIANGEWIFTVEEAKKRIKGGM
jgi:hypothetical protein